MARVNGGNINFNVNMTVQKNGLNEITQPLKQIQNQLSSLSTDKIDKEFQEAAASAKQLESIINSSWNDKLGQLNLDKFNQSVNTSYGSVAKLRQSLSGAGVSGQHAFNNLAYSVLTTNLQLRQSNKLLDSMATSMANTVKWGITSSIFNTITSSIKSAYYYAKDLDTSLNNIRIVTGQSADEMQRFAKVANNAAGDLGRSTLDYTKAALSFYQQGLSDEEVQARTNITLKAQNITGVGSEMVDYLTSVWNGFKATAEDAEGYVDKLAKVADSSASDMSELAIAMSKVAATANLVGVDVDQLTAQLATVIATTRQAPESVGTAFKTIYSRINDIKTGAEDAQISLGNYSGKMAELGFNVLNANGQLRDTGQVLEQIGSRWNTLSKAQQIYLAQTMGGQRQITQISALFENWATYSDLLNDSLTAQGTLNQKNNVYLESTAAHMKQLSAESERTKDVLINTDSINTFSDAIRSMLNTFNDFLEGVGGGIKVFTYFGSFAAGIFNKQISSAILNTKNNIQSFFNEFNLNKFKEQYANEIIKNNQNNYFESEKTTVHQDAIIAKAKQEAEIYTQSLQARKGLNQEQQKQLTNYQKQIGQLTEQKYLLEHIEQIRSQYGAQSLTNIELIKQEEKSLKNKEQSQSSILSTLTQIKLLEQNEAKTAQDQLKLQQLYQILLDKEVLTETEEKQLLAGEVDTQTVLNSLIQKHEIQYKDINGQLQKITSLKELQLKLDKGQLQIINGQLVAVKQKSSQLQGIGKQVNQTQNIVKGLSAAGQALSAWAGAAKTLGDESATAAEKTNAAFSGVQGTISGIGTMFGPMGMGIATLVNGVISLLKEVTPLGDWVENFFKSTSEKIDELNKKLKDVSSSVATDSKTISSLQDVQKEWNTLFEKVQLYGLQSDKITEDQKNRYQELLEEFSKYNGNVITGYDLQGNAIATNQEALKQTIKLLKEQKRAAAEAAFGDVNQNIKTGNLEFTDPYTQKTNKQNEIKQLYNKRKEEINSELDSILLNFNNDFITLSSYLSTALIGKNNFLNQLTKGFSGSSDLSFLKNENNTGSIPGIENFPKDIDQLLITLTDVINNNEQLLQHPEWITSIQKIFDNLANMSQIDANRGDFSSIKQKIDQLSEVVNIYNNSDINKEIENAQSELQLLEKNIQDLEHGRVQFNDTLIMQALQYGDGYKDAFIKLQSLDSYNNDIYQTIIDYISGYTFNKELEEADIKNKQASTYEDVLAAGEDFVENLYNILTTYQKLITDAVSKVTKDASDFKTIEQYKQYLLKKINTVLSAMNPEDFQTQESRKALSEYLAQAFNFDNLDIIEVDGNLKINTDAVSLKIQQQYENALNDIFDTLDKFGYKKADKKSITKDFLEELINPDQIAEFDEILNQIDWGAFLKYTQAGQSASEALTKAYKDTKEAREDLAKDQLDFDTVFNTDELIEHLDKKKKLTDEEQAYLNFLEKEDDQLAQIARLQGRSSDNYIKHIKQKIQYGQQYYLNSLKSEKELAQIELANAQATLKSIFASNDAIEEAKGIIALKEQEILDLNYEIARSENAITENVRKRKDAQRDAKLEEAKKNESLYDNANSALTKLQNPENGVELTSEEAAAIAYIQKINPLMASLAENEETRGRLGREYLGLLEEQLPLLKEISKESKQQQKAILEADLESKKQELKDLQDKIISDEEYQAAKKLLVSNSLSQQNSSTNNKSSVGLQALNPISLGANEMVQPSQDVLNDAKETVAAYESQNQLLEDRDALLNGIEETSAALVILETNTAEEAQKVNTAASQRLATFRELSQTLASGGKLSAEQMSQLDGVLSKLLERYPELSTQADLLKETWLSGTQMYKDALRQIDEALQQMSYEELNENLTNAADELIDTLNQEYILINVDPSDFEDFQKQVKEFLDADKTITIAVHTDAENDFNRIQEELNGIYDAASKIGQNFIVAANDIRELDTVFPGIMQGMQRLDDGSYQLNSNIVQRAISTAKTSAAADAQAVTDQLHNQASLLRQKAKIYTEMGKAAGILAGTVIDHDMSAADAQALISQDLEKLKTTNAKLAVDNQMQNQKTLVDNTDENAGIVANNWASSAQSISDSIYRATSASIQNFAAMAEAGQAAARLQVRTPGTYNPNIGSTYNGSQGTTGDTVDIDDLTSDYLNNPDTTQDQWAQIQKKYNQMAAVNEAAAADIDRMVAEIGANVSRVGEGLDNVTRGQGIKGSSDKNKSSSSGSSPRSSSPKSSSGSSSKSSSDKAETEKEAEKIETLTDEKDRYHDINLQIKAIEKNLSKVQDREKKLYGKDLIKNLNQQLAILEQQIDAYETKIGLAADERNEIQDSLKAQGVLFDSNTGAITNYAAALDNKLKEINSIINYYNHLSASQQENYKDTVEQAKKDYEDFKKQIENYDKLVSETIPELKQEIRKERDKQVEIAISKFKMAIEIELDLSDARKNWNDFKKKVIDQIREDDVLGQTRSTLENLFAYYDKNNRSKGLIPSLTDQVTNLMQQLDQINSGGFGNVYGNNKAQALEDLENYAKELMDSLEDVEDIIKEVEEAFYDMVDAAQDAFDEQIKEYDFLSNLINHDEKMIQLLYGDQAFDKVSKYYQKQIESDKKELDFQREQKDFWYAKMQAEKNHMERLDEESNAYKEAEKRFKELEDHWLDSLEDFNDGVEKSIQNLLTQYKNNVEIIFKDLDNILTKGKGLEYVEEEWELINDSADDFLDKINSMYEIQKLQNAFQDALKDNQDNLAAQKSINNLMTQQLKMLKDKDRLTKYDVDRANLLLQIELKRLALQQSRSNKSKLRLRRDSQGNYTYQYTADEEQISKAEQDLADARNSLYNLDKNQYNKNLGDILSIQQDFNDKLKALYEEYPVWTEQAESKRQLIIEQYGLRINGMVEQNENIRLNLYQSAFDEMAALYDADVQNFTNMSRTQQDQLMTNLIPQWNSGIQEMTNTIAGQGGFIPTCKEAFEELKTNTQDYKESLQDLQSSAGVNFENISNGIDWDIVKTQELIDDNRQLINTYNQEWDALQRIIDQVRTLTQVYTTAKNEAIAAAQAANDYIEWERQSAVESATADASSGNDNYVDYDELDDLIDLWYPQIDDVSGSSGSSSSGSSSSSSSGTAKKSSSSSDKKKKSNNSGATWQRIVQVYNLINSGQVNNDPYRHNNLANLGYNNTEIAKGQELINKVYPPSLGGAGMTWDAARKAMGYKTGGYTGEWGQEGKIGILHEKELILNAEDTKNILSAVESARDITKLLRLIDTNVTLSNTLSGLTRQNISDVNQQVHITATFPSVNSRVEIEEAFSNLINRASQYSFNTRK